MTNKILPIAFYRLASGREPVREWLQDLALADRKILGADLKTVEYGCDWYAFVSSIGG